jgi:predicted  nucleic acid-binding Zn-ribbon protein
MKHISLFVILWSRNLNVVDAGRDSATPLGKVRQLLADLKNKVQEEGNIESISYQKFTRWCDLEAQHAKTTIVSAQDDMRDSKAQADQARAMQQTLQFELEKIQYQVAGKEKELEQAVDRRKKEHQAFLKADKQFAQTVGTLGKALDILSKPASKQAMLELSNVLAESTRQQKVGTVSNERMQSFFQSVAADGEAMDASETQSGSAPSAPVYASKSGELKAVVVEMRDDVKADRAKIQKEETSMAHSFEKWELACKNEIAAMKGKMEERKKALAAAQAEEARAMQALADATNLRDRMQAHLGEVTATCQEKAREFETREKSRAEELTVLAEALSLLSDEKTGAAEARRGAAAFIQVSMSQQGLKIVKPHEIENLLRSAMDGETSQALNFLQSGSQAGADPFAKVKKMMEGMIKKLLNEAAEEQEHKAWCDSEIAKTTKQQKYHERNQNKFKSRVEEYTAELDKLGKKVFEVSGSIAEMTQAAGEMTKQRQEESAQATAAIKEYADAQSAVQKATQVISDFYEKKARNAALLQAEAAQNPPPDTGFSGTNPGEKRGDAASSIIGILEIALSDFARLQSELQTEEVTAQREYVSYMQSFKVQKAVAEQEIKHLNEAQTKVKGDIFQAKGDLANTEEELKAVQEYMEELDKSCNFAGPTLEERQARRQKQIEGLQNALAIIAGEALP